VLDVMLSGFLVILSEAKNLPFRAGPLPERRFFAPYRHSE